MSVTKNYYVIAGYDLSAFETQAYDDWKWSDEGQEYLDFHKTGYVQLFDDPMSGGYLYLGYIIAAGDEYQFDTTINTIYVESINLIKEMVDETLHKLINIGVISNVEESDLKYVIIAFEECT